MISSLFSARLTTPNVTHSKVNISLKLSNRVHFKATVQDTLRNLYH